MPYDARKAVHVVIYGIVAIEFFAALCTLPETFIGVEPRLVTEVGATVRAVVVAHWALLKIHLSNYSCQDTETRCGNRTVLLTLTKPLQMTALTTPDSEPKAEGYKECEAEVVSFRVFDTSACGWRWDYL